MPGPPTPLSGSSLKRLELHDSSTTSRVYDAAQLANSLTLTLEAQRSVTADNHNLVLQVHCGLQRVLSIKLTDLLQSPRDKTETISIERRLQRLCIRIHQQSRTILADFDEVRDFNVAVCMLRKFGFQIKDGVSVPYSTNASDRPTSPLYTIPPRTTPIPAAAPTDFGPRLSSITPLPGPDCQIDSEVQQAFSFPSMLNADFMPTQALSDHIYHHFSPASPPIMQNQFAQTPLSPHLSIPLTQQIPRRMTSLPHLNPYTMFLGKQSNYYLHQPRVSSPLRNSLGSEDQSTKPTLSPGHVIHPGQSATGMFQNHRSISAPLVRSNSQQGFDIFNPYSQDSSDEPAQRENPRSSVSEDASHSQLQNATQDDLSSQPAQDFRELMPQPRSLPFARRQKVADKVDTSRTPPQKEARPPSLADKHKKDARSSRGGRTNPRAGRKNNGTAHSSSNEGIKRKPLKEVSATISDAECQTRSPPEASQPVSLSNNSPAGHSSSASATEVPTMLVADPDLLRQASQVAARLLEQYEADIARGCDEGACAQFYVEQIHTARRDFWFAQLKEIECGRRLSPV